MGRKKKNLENNDGGSLEMEKKPRLNLASDAKRSALAIILIALALLIVLAFFRKAGIIGEYLDTATGSMLGIVKIIFPLFLLLAAGVLLFRKETSFYVTKIAGLFIALLSITGIIHWFYEPDKMLLVASKGMGGGYIGYVVAYLSSKYLGVAGSFVVIASLFFIGIVVAFNFSIMHLLEKMNKKEKERDEKSKEGEAGKILENLPEEIADKERMSVEKILPEEALLSEKKYEKESVNEGGENIANIEFKEGRDQFISADIAEKVGNNLVLQNEKKNTKSEKKKKVSTEEETEWQLPPIELLEKSSGISSGGDIDSNFEIIERTLRNFGIIVERGEAKVGPAVTQYSLRPAVGVKIAKIMALQNDLSLALAKHPIRIEAPIPGKSLIGIEIPNTSSVPVKLRDILENDIFEGRESDLMIALGKDVSGSAILGDVSKMPHLMIAGSTGTGKSVCINSLITSLLYQNSPSELRMIMVDPKRVELSLYNGIPHLLGGAVIVDNSKVISALRWAVSEMERRYKLLQEVGTRDIASYKEFVNVGKKRKVVNPETGKAEEFELEKLPYIVIIIDELSDLMLSHGKEVEGAIVRIAQMARAVGIHLIVSTQRPSVEVITGLIKANIATRIAFQVATQIDSRTILDMSGAEKLLGRGDMLYVSAASPKPKRIQGAFITESEVKKVVKFIKNQKFNEEKAEDDLDNSQEKRIDTKPAEFNDYKDNEQEDNLYDVAKEEVIRSKKASASFLQRRLRVGYARAARLLDLLEEKGIIGPGDGAKAREVYAPGGENDISYGDVSADQEKRDKWQM
jgi:DNA segregation ATPase FtsK/SpoIIIE, S-DNA-T family